jgi:hypothetical protein
MPIARDHFRIVVQQVSDVEEDVLGCPYYRLVVYNARQVFKPVKFVSPQDLLSRLGSVVTDFAERDLRLKEARGTHIVFTAEMKLTAAQLSLLGLERAD